MTENTVGNVSTRNDSETRRADTGKIRGICSRPVRYRLIDGDGKAYAPFRLKPGVTYQQIAANTPGSKGGWTIEVMGVGR